MPNTPIAKLLVSRNGGAVQSGAVVCQPGDTIQLSSQSTSQRYTLFQIYGYPKGWAVPAGWSQDSSSGYIYFNGLTPPSFTLPALGVLWGKWMPLLQVENGMTNGLVDPLRTDTSTALTVLSPNAGLKDMGSQETNQFQASWAAEHQDNLRTIDSVLSPTGATSRSGHVYIANASLSALSQWAPVNTQNGSFTITMPTIAPLPLQITVGDTGFALASHPVTVASGGGGYQIFCPAGPNAGTLQTSFTMNVSGETYTFALTPPDPTNSLSTTSFWMPVGDGVTAVSLGGVYTGNASLLPVSQWVPVNTQNGAFTVTLNAGVLPAIQISFTDTGKACDTKPLTINGGVFKIWNPSGPNAGTLQSTYVMNQRSASYVFNLTPADATNSLSTSPFWMPV